MLAFLLLRSLSSLAVWRPSIGYVSASFRHQIGLHTRTLTRIVAFGFVQLFWSFRLWFYGLGFWGPQGDDGLGSHLKLQSSRVSPVSEGTHTGWVAHLTRQ